MRKNNVFGAVAGCIALMATSMPASGFSPFKVSSIKVEGLRQVSIDAVNQYLTIKKGSTVGPNDTSAILEELYDSGLFESIELMRDGDSVIVFVKERPVINDIKIKGIKTTKEIKEILRDNDVLSGHMYDPSKVDRALDLIEKHYLAKGNFNVDISSESKESGEGVELTINIYEGSGAKIKEISFVGNNSFPAKEIKDSLVHKTTWLMSWYTKTDRYAKEKLLADVEGIRSFYLDRGYVNVQVDSSQVSLSPDKKNIYINFKITEGVQFLFGNMKLSGDIPIDRDDLEKPLLETIQKGEVFSRKKVAEVKSAMEKALGAKGFSKSEIRLDFVPDEANRTVNIDFYVVPNSRVMVRNINFKGNTLTKDTVLRRNIPQQEATWISTDLVEFGREAIERHGFSKNVTVSTEDVVGTDDVVDINFELEEQRSTKFSAGIQYSSADKLILNLSAEMVNFLGTGKDIDFVFERSKSFSNYSFGYFNPDFYGDNVGMGYRFYFNETKLSKASNVFDYTSDSKGGSVYWSIPLSRYNSLLANFAYDKTKLRFTDAAKPVEINNFLTSQGSSFKEWSATLQLKHNSQDKYIFPTKGMFQSLSVKYTMPFSDLKYYKLDYDLSWNKKVYKDIVFNAGTTLGYAKSYGSSPYYPFYKNYFTGGAESVRGFEDRSLGPKDSQGREAGGNALINLRSSLISPPPFSDLSSSVRLSVFVEAGQVYDTIVRTRTVNGVVSNRNPTGIRASYGASFKWYTPLGVPLEFSVAKPIVKKPGDKLHVTSFSFGMVFN